MHLRALTVNVVALATLGFGCDAYTKGAQRNVQISEHALQKGHVAAFSTPADLRLGFMHHEADGFSYCAEPFPDVALGSEASANAGLKADSALKRAATQNAELNETNEALRQENRELRNELQHLEQETERRQTEQGQTESTRTSKSTAGRKTGSTSEFDARSSAEITAALRLAISVSELGGRSQEVLLAREFLYRICEARANGFFKDPKTFAEQQTNALRLMQVLYEARFKAAAASESATQASLLKNIIEFNEQQTGLCKERFTACDAAAAGDAAKKKACSEARQKCVDGIELLKPAPPKPSGDEKEKAAPPTILTVPN